MSDIDIFNMNIEDFKSDEKPQKKSDIYLPDPKKGKDNTFKALIRFLPNIDNPKKSSIYTISYWLEDPRDEGKGFKAFCPSTVGDKSIIKDTYWELKKSGNAFLEEKATKLKRKEYYFSYVYIVKDGQNKENEGTVQIFRYPKTIKEMIDAQLNPSKEQIELGEVPTNIFDFFEGKDFLLQVKIKGGYWNYDDCKFANSSSSIKIEGAEVERNEEGAAALKALYETAPTKLEEFDYQPWDEDTRIKVENYLRQLKGESATVASREEEPKASAQPSSPAPEQVMDSNEESNDSDDIISEWLDD